MYLICLKCIAGWNDLHIRIRFLQSDQIVLRFCMTISYHYLQRENDKFGIIEWPSIANVLLCYVILNACHDGYNQLVFFHPTQVDQFPSCQMMYPSVFYSIRGTDCNRVVISLQNATWLLHDLMLPLNWSTWLLQSPRYTFVSYYRIRKDELFFL